MCQGSMGFRCPESLVRKRVLLSLTRTLLMVENNGTVPSTVPSTLPTTLTRALTRALPRTLPRTSQRPLFKFPTPCTQQLPISTESARDHTT